MDSGFFERSLSGEGETSGVQIDDAAVLIVAIYKILFRGPLDNTSSALDIDDTTANNLSHLPRIFLFYRELGIYASRI